MSALSSSAVFKDVLLAHYRKPHHRGALEGAATTCRGHNPSCGDEVEVGVFYRDSALQEVRFEGRGCSICIASASLMSCAVEGMAAQDVKALCAEVKISFSPGTEQFPLPEALAALAVVQGHTARRRCALLCWDALEGALQRKTL